MCFEQLTKLENINDTSNIVYFNPVAVTLFFLTFH